MSQTLLFITGASRGLGRAIGIAFASSSSIRSVRAILVARSEHGLAETATLMQEAAQQSSTDVEVSYIVADLSDLDKLETTVKDIFEPLQSSPSSFDKAILINNAGSLGYLGQCRDMTSLTELQHAVNFNITSSIWLSSQFTRIFASEEGDTGSSGGMCIIVNVSSLCAIEPFKTMSVYCAGKAARDMFNSVFAMEEETNLSGSSSSTSRGSCKILNYAPGMCETAMSVELAESNQLDTDLGMMYQTSWKEKTMVQPKDTADKLVRIIMADAWKSGAHIDYWD